MYVIQIIKVDKYCTKLINQQLIKTIEQYF